MKCLPALLSWLLAAGTAVASPVVAPLEPGMLLVAREALPDPRFTDTVVLVVQNDARGTVGLIINRPSRLTLGEATPTLPEFAGRDAPLSYGGPLSPRALLALVKVLTAPPDPAQQIFAATYLTGVEQLAAWPERERQGTAYRVFSGHSGWAPGQLAGELARGDWQILPADEALLFSGDLPAMWEKLARPAEEPALRRP